MDRWNIYEILKNHSLSATNTSDIDAMDVNELKEGICEWLLSIKR